jgi:DNA-binding transcriptional regulator YiaG
MPRKPRDWQRAMRGADIKKLRVSADLSQAKLATLLGVHANTIARWEREELYISEPVSRFLKLICEQAKKSSEPP